MPWCTPSGRDTSTLSRPSRFAFASVSSSALGLTSTAYTFAAGDTEASDNAIEPQPQPMSRKTPLGGGMGARSKSTDVPRSRRL